MPRVKFKFTNSSDMELAGLLELPEQSQPITEYAIFAHCFTCGKDIAAATRISRSLAAKGIAVLRFDFTGLGNSDGDFANTNFSSNVNDLLAAAQSLKERYLAPTLLIGHSLGGAAVLSAAEQIPSIKAVCTIASPATAEHVQHLFPVNGIRCWNRGKLRLRLDYASSPLKNSCSMIWNCTVHLNTSDNSIKRYLFFILPRMRWFLSIRRR